jgi:plastocyanin
MKKVLFLSGRYLLLFVILVGLCALSACSGAFSPAGLSDTPEPPPTAPEGSSAAITLANFAFAPASITVKAGTKVTWTNKDSTTHTITSDTGAFDSGNLAPNASFSVTFSTPGTFSYHCSLHPSMLGTVIVQ